jgi:hypothetical protein
MMRTPIFFALILLVSTLLWSAPGTWLAQDASPTPAETITATLAPSLTATITTTPTVTLTPTLTPVPAEYIETPDQTTGILFGAVFLVIIILGGTFFILRRKR